MAIGYLIVMNLGLSMSLSKGECVMKKQSIKEYLLENYEIETIKDIVEHGCSGGIRGFIYYTETVAFHDEHEKEIWDMLYEDAEDMDQTILEYVSKFNGQKDVGSMYQFKNLLTWYAVEAVARGIVDELEESNN